METKFEQQLLLWPADDHRQRIDKVVANMKSVGLDAVIVSDNANIYYLTGRIICGYIYIDASGSVRYFVRRPNNLCGEGLTYIRKPEDIAELLAGDMPDSIGLELSLLPYSTIERLKKVFANASIGDSGDVLRRSRAVKTSLEIEMMAQSGIHHARAYSHIPSLYRPGMTDIELQIELERALRLEGCLGLFRMVGPDMEFFMSNTLTGDNSDMPTPYDFALGGAGMSPSLPLGANGTLIEPGKTVMIDACGNFTGYMTDMTRCYCPGQPCDMALRANDLSREISAAIADKARPGMATAELYQLACSMAEKAGMADYLMGHNYHAGFVGHGLGISINESPVLAPRSRDILVAGNAIAVEPKFVIPCVGAVGVENTFIVQDEGAARKLTLAPEEIANLL